MRVPYQQLKQHVAAGPSGMRNEYLRCLVGEYAPASRHAAVRDMSEVASMYLQGRLPGWFNRLFASARLVAHVKKLGEGRAPDVRPVVVGEAERRAAERAVVDNMKEAYVPVLAPSQLGVGISAGDSMLIHGVRLIAEKLGPRAAIVHTDLRNAYNEAWRRTIIQRHIDCSPLHPVIPALLASLSTDSHLIVDDQSAPVQSEDGVHHGAPLATTSFCVAIHPEMKRCDSTFGGVRGLEVRFDKMQAYIADMEAARQYVQAYMRGEAEELRDEVDASMSKLLSSKPSRRYTHALHHHAWALLKHCMQHMAGYWLRNCLPSEVEAFAEAVDATVHAAVERVLGVSFDPSTYGTDTNPVVPDLSAELLHDPDPMAAELRGRYAREMEREVEAASGFQKEPTAFLDQANSSRLRNEVCALPVTCRERILFNQLDAALGMWTVAIPIARTVLTPHELREASLYGGRWMDDLFHQAVPLGNTVPMDDLKDLVPDAELSLPAFNVVTGRCDPRSLKSTMLEFKTMRYGVKYTAVPRAMAVDRFERSLLGDIQRGLAARDAAWHNTEPGQKGPLRDILDMSEYTGMVFGTVGETCPWPNVSPRAVGQQQVGSRDAIMQASHPDGRQADGPAVTPLGDLLRSAAESTAAPTGDPAGAGAGELAQPPGVMDTDGGGGATPLALLLAGTSPSSGHASPEASCSSAARLGSGDSSLVALLDGSSRDVGGWGDSGAVPTLQKVLSLATSSTPAEADNLSLSAILARNASLRRATSNAAAAGSSMRQREGRKPAGSALAEVAEEGRGGAASTSAATSGGAGNVEMAATAAAKWKKFLVTNENTAEAARSTRSSLDVPEIASDYPDGESAQQGLLTDTCSKGAPPYHWPEAHKRRPPRLGRLLCVALALTVALVLVVTLAAHLQAPEDDASLGVSLPAPAALPAPPPLPMDTVYLHLALNITGYGLRNFISLRPKLVAAVANLTELMPEDVRVLSVSGHALKWVAVDIGLRVEPTQGLFTVSAVTRGARDMAALAGRLAALGAEAGAAPRGMLGPSPADICAEKTLAAKEARAGNAAAGKTARGKRGRYKGPGLESLLAEGLRDAREECSCYKI
eukprot:jgi/Tetstr1/423470/TSEL_014151.t1